MFNRFKSSRIFGEFNITDLSGNIIVSHNNFLCLKDISNNIQTQFNDIKYRLYTNDISFNVIYNTLNNIDYKFYLNNITLSSIIYTNDLQTTRLNNNDNTLSSIILLNDQQTTRLDNIDITLSSIIYTNNYQNINISNLQNDLSLLNLNMLTISGLIQFNTTNFNNVFNVIDISLNIINNRLNNIDAALSSITLFNVTDRLNILDASMNNVILANNIQNTRLDNIDNTLSSIIYTNNNQNINISNLQNDLSLLNLNLLTTSGIIQFNTTNINNRFNVIDISLNIINNRLNDYVKKNVDFQEITGDNLFSNLLLARELVIVDISNIGIIENNEFLTLNGIDTTTTIQNQLNNLENNCAKKNATFQEITGENLFSNLLLARELVIVDTQNNGIIENNEFLTLEGVDTNTTIQNQLNNCAKTNVAYQEIAGENRFTDTIYTRNLEINDANFNPIVDQNEFLTLNGINTSTTIQSQLNGKANINNPTFTGTVNGITKSMVGLGNVENLTMTSILKIIYPIGSIYINYNDTRNPNTIFGYTVGTWVQIAAETFLMADTTGGVTGGKSTHDHRWYKAEDGFGSSNANTWKLDTTNAASHRGSSWTRNIGETLIDNSGELRQNFWTDETTLLPPYLSVIMWRRTA